MGGLIKHSETAGEGDFG